MEGRWGRGGGTVNKRGSAAVAVKLVQKKNRRERERERWRDRRGGARR